MKGTFILFQLFFAATLFAQPVTTLRLDPQNAMGGTASQIFEEIHYIPLETTPESTFGLVAKLGITGRYFIILDEKGTILIFNKTGKFHARIPGTFVKTKFGLRKGIEYFTIDYKKQQIITGGYGNTRSYFDFDGKFLKTEPFPQGVLSFIRLGENHFANMLYRYDSANIRAGMEPYFLSYTNNRNDSSHFWLPYNYHYFSRSTTRSPGFFSSGRQGECFFALRYNYNVYQLDTAGISHIYQYVFPLKNTLPSAIADSVYSIGEGEYSRGHPSQISSIDYIFKAGNYLTFRLNAFNANRLGDQFIYDLGTQKLVSLSRVTPDSLSFYLPFLSGSAISACDGSSFYTTIPSFVMFLSKDNSEKEVTYNSVLENYFTNRSRKDNAVIVQLKPKVNP